MAEIFTEEMTKREIIVMAMKEALTQLSESVEAAALVTVAKLKGTKSPGLELYWEGYVDGQRDTATTAREVVRKLE